MKALTIALKATLAPRAHYAGLDGKRDLLRFNVRFWPKPDTILSSQDARLTRQYSGPKKVAVDLERYSKNVTEYPILLYGNCDCGRKAF